MADDEKWIQIAEACGWTRLELKIVSLGKRNSIMGSTQALAGTPPGQQTGDCEEPFEVIPDYLNDLNAMHEAEKCLSEDQQEAYHDHIDEMKGDERRFWHWTHCTARQRSEAFIKTIEQ